jgi:tight adherence protein B
VNETWLISGLVFGAAVLGFEALYWLLFQTRGTQKSINRRLALSKQVSNRTELLDALRRERGFADFKSPAFASLNDLLVQTGLRLSKEALLLWVVMLGIAILALTVPILGLHPISFVPALVLAPLLVLLILRMIRAKRIARFAEQLPDAVDIIVRGLRVGHPFSVAIDLVARELPDPIGSEFGMTADEITFGQGVAAAIDNLYRRVGQEDLLFLVVSINIQTQTGGNLAEILSRLSRLIRLRTKLKLKVRALSAEGRMSAYFLTAMPFILFGIISLLSPNYFSEVGNSIWLIPALLYGGLSLLIGNIVIYRMVHFKF